MNFLDLKINGSNIKIKFGNIKEPNDGITVINFNEYFDTKTDNKIINKNSLNGEFIDENIRDIEKFDKFIEDSLLEESKYNDIICKKNCRRKNPGGKTIKYNLGTMVYYENYALLAFTHFDQNDHNFLNTADYACCLMKMWENLNLNYKGKNIYLTLAGKGVTRIKDNSSISSQEALETMLWTFKECHISFSDTVSVNIILREKIKNELNLYKLKEFED